MLKYTKHRVASPDNAEVDDDNDDDDDDGDGDMMVTTTTTMMMLTVTRKPKEWMGPGCISFLRAAFSLTNNKIITSPSKRNSLRFSVFTTHTNSTVQHPL